MKVLLFDIDGTLLFSGGAGKRAMSRAFRDVYGVEDGFSGVSMSGKTDGQILREALRLNRIEQTADSMEAFRRRYFDYLREEIRSELPGKRLVSGVRELLASLADEQRVLLGLLTGNWRVSAYIKLEHFGIDRYFPFGAFADDSEDRDELLPIALRRARRRAGVELRPQDAWVIGDTPRDVQCGLVHGARVLAVAASEYDPDTLRKAGATAVVPDFSDWKGVLQLLLDERGVR